MENATKPMYTVEDIPAGAQTATITPEMYASLNEQQKAALPPNIRQQIEAAMKAAGNIPQNPNKDKVEFPNSADMLGIAREEYEKLSWKDRMKVRRETDKVIGRRWYEFYSFDVKNQNDWSMVIAGAVIGVIITAGVILLVGYFKKD